MDKKEENKICNGYESMYLFLNEDDFKKHLQECEECRKEHEKMQKISSLIQEAKPYIKAKQKQNKLLRAACALSLVFFSSLSVPFLFHDAQDVYDNLVAHTSGPTVEEMGLPVDEYGFLLIE